MTRLGSTFVSEDTDARGQVGPAGNDSTVPGPAGEDSTVPGPAGEDGIVASVVAGTSVTVDATDPANPIVNATNQVTKLEVSGFFGDTPGDSAKIVTMIVSTGFTLPASLTNSEAFVEVVSTGSVVIDIQKNGASVGSINFATATAVATFTFSSGTAFVAGDRLQLIAPATADATLADISFTLRGTL